MIKLILPLVLIVGIIGGVYLVQNRVNLFPKAAEQPFQEKIVISNLAPTSLSISYFTKESSYDFIQYGEDTSVATPVYEARTKDGLNPKLYTHYFRIKDLKPNTKYYFKINSNGRLLPAGEYLTFKTPSGIRGRASIENFSGTVKKENGQDVAEGLVFLSTDDGQLLSTPVNEDGSWTISYVGMRTADMSKYLNISETDQVKFLAYAGLDGFGLFGEYAFRKEDIGVTVYQGTIPFYRINLGQQGVGVEGAANEDEVDNRTLWVRVADFLKGAF